MGTVIHKLIEDARCGKVVDLRTIEERFDQLIVEREAHLAESTTESRWIPLSEAVHEYSYLRERSINLAVRSLAAPLVAQGAARRRSGPEVGVSSREGRARGKIDEVELSPMGPIIRDLKTGGILEASPTGMVLKRPYVEQLFLYAAIYAEDSEISGGRWPNTLELVPLIGDKVRVEYEQGACTGLLDRAIAVLDEINEVIEAASSSEAERQLANPKPETCRWCQFRPVCRTYRSMRAQRSPGDWPIDVMGVVRGVKSLGNGTVSLMVESENESVRVRGLDPEMHPALADVTQGSCVGIFGLVPQGGTNTVGEGRFSFLILA